MTLNLKRALFAVYSRLLAFCYASRVARIARRLGLGGIRNALWTWLAPSEPISFHGVRILFGKDASAASQISTGGYESYELKLFLSVVQPGMNVLDVGANVGVYSVLAGRKLLGTGGRVFSVEPEPGNIALLKQNIALNGLDNVTVIEKAASDVSESLSLFLDRIPGRHSLTRFREKRKYVSVVAARIDSVIAENIPIQIIKMDIEGWEQKALRGMTRLLNSPDLTHLFIEFFPALQESAGEDPNALVKQLENLGFAISHVNEERGDMEPASSKDVVTTVAKRTSEFGLRHINLLATRRAAVGLPAR